MRLLDSLDEQGFRKLIHIPEYKDLVASGVSSKIAEAIENSMPAKLLDWRTTAKIRAGQDRGLVRAFNKVKHHLYAFPTVEHGVDELWLPSRIKFDKARSRINLERSWIEVSENKVKRFAADAIASQVLLHDTLALILVTRYGYKYKAPRWVVKAVETDYLWHHESLPKQ